MEAWTAADEGWLLRVENDLSCGAMTDGDLFVLLDSDRRIDRVWQEEVWTDDESETSVHYEVEDGEFIGSQETVYFDGRTNYAREVEIEDLVSFPAQRILGEDRLRELLRRHFAES